jgi:secreted PhoX family phosphatase
LFNVNESVYFTPYADRKMKDTIFKRFLPAPAGSEVTGVAAYGLGGVTTPSRSAAVMITKNDGGMIVL